MDTIILDIGSETIKAGFAGRSRQVVIPTVVGIPRHPGIMIGMNQKDTYFGDEAYSKRGILTLRYPVEFGIVTDWTEMEKLWHHVFYNELRVDPSEYHVIVTEPPMNPKATRERTIQIMFDKFSIKGFQMELQPVLALFASGRTSGIVLDSGEAITHVAPVHEGFIIPHAILRMRVGGRDLTLRMGKLLVERGYCFSSGTRFLDNDIKERLCYVAKNFEEEMRISDESSAVERNYELPDGNQITIGNERFRCPEVLFQPNVPGFLGIHEMIFESINKCQIELDLILFQNIVLCGASTLFPGIKERLQVEIEKMVPSGVIVKVIGSHDRKYASYTGASVVAAETSFADRMISKHDYDLFGPIIVHQQTTLAILV